VISLPDLGFCHALRYVSDAVIQFKVAEEGDTVIDGILDYQASAAYAAFYDVLVTACFYYYFFFHT
jgi:hypothetical protein